MARAIKMGKLRVNQYFLSGENKCNVHIASTSERAQLYRKLGYVLWNMLPKQRKSLEEILNFK